LRRRATSRPPEPIPGLLAASLAVSIPTPLTIFSIIFLFLVRRGAESLFFHNERILRLAPIAWSNLDLPILDRMRNLWPKNLIVKFQGLLTVEKLRVILDAAVLKKMADFPFGWVDNIGDESEPSASPRVLISHHGYINKISKLLEIQLQIDFFTKIIILYKVLTLRRVQNSSDEVLYVDRIVLVRPMALVLNFHGIWADALATRHLLLLIVHRLVRIGRQLLLRNRLLRYGQLILYLAKQADQLI